MSDEDTEQIELEWECDECASYIMMRLSNRVKENPLDDPTNYTEFESDLSMWIHDHFSKEE